MKNTTEFGDAPTPDGVTFGSRRNLLIGHAIALIMVCICYGFGWSQLMTEREFWVNGVPRNAAVTRKEITVGPPSRSRSSKNYTVWYRYQDDHGQEHQGRGNVVDQLWNQLQEGNAVEIVYLRDQPASSRLVGRPFTERWSWLILLATGNLIVMAFVGLWILAGWRWLGRRKARAVRNGMDTVAIREARAPI